MLKVSDGGGSPNHDPVKRGEVKGFSAAARKRMLELLNQLTFERITFVTLTYPKEWNPDGHEYKKHLRRFRARMERKYPKIRVLWRLEFQKRGAPHFHLLLFDAPFLCRFCLSYDWYKSVSSGDRKHLKYGTNVRGVASRGENGKIISYVAKYAAKPLQEGAVKDDDWTGRYYGRWNIKTPDPIELEIGVGGAVRVTLGALSLRGGRSPYEPNNLTRCSIFGSNMGGGEFSSIIIDTSEAIGAKRINRKLDS
jgi:hypothetical protein